MARTIVTGRWFGEDYAEAIIIPIVMTIPDPRRPHRTGTSRLRRAVVLPANGWAKVLENRVAEVADQFDGKEASPQLPDRDGQNPDSAFDFGGVHQVAQYDPRKQAAVQGLASRAWKRLFDRWFGSGTGAPSPALRDDPYHPDVVDTRVKPPYAANPAHDRSRPLPNKTPEPDDAANVYRNAIAGDDMMTFYGVNSEGKIYRFFRDNAGGAHFSGVMDADELPPETRRSLGIR